MKLKGKINVDVERKLQDAVFVGRLANKDDLATTLIQDPVYLKSELGTDVQFHIKCLSPIPKEVSDQFYFPNEIITGSTVSNNNNRKLSDWIDFDRLPYIELVDKVRAFLENKLIAFTLNVNVKTENVYVELLRVENIPPSDKGYEIIPGPQLRIEEGLEDFENKLVGERKPFTLKHYPHIFDMPEFVYFQGSIFQVGLKPNLNATTYTQKEEEEVWYRSSIEEEFMQLVDLRVEDHLYFIPKDKITYLQELVMNHSLNEKYEEEQLQIEREQRRAENLQTLEEAQKNAVQNKFNKAENDFIQNLNRHAKRSGLFFDEKDLLAFHISAKTNLLTIIGGMSGTGKSQLAKIYGETLGLEYGKELLMIPVSPSYHEPNDVLGYLNPTTGVYHESETGLVRLLLEAEQSPEKMFMVIFDEMNLSQVEHWFSPFISLLEVDEDERYLTLFNESSYCLNDKYKSKIKIRNNIIFVGTVNFDETTKDFSDRLLDRTNVIIPKKLTFEESIQKMLHVQSDMEEEMIPSSMQTSVYRKEWVSDRKKSESLQVFTVEEITLLDAIHELLQQMDRQKGVSFRSALGIAHFLDNIPKKENGELLMDRREAFDIQFTQRILTKINGLSSFVEPLVGTFDGEAYEHGSIADILQSETGQAVSDFQISDQFLKEKAKELMLYGYAK